MRRFAPLECHSFHCRMFRVSMRHIINSTQLARGFTSVSRDSQELLPHLVRRLIAATVPVGALSRFIVPSGDDIRRHGFDGSIDTKEGNPFVPSGQSVWEFGVGDDPETKFKKDYEARVKDPKGLITSETTFVFVTPRAWAGKAAAERDRQAEGIWKSVRILDNSDLETWIELAPAVGRWIAGQLGVPVEGMDDVEEHLKMLSAKYRCDVTSELILGGRTEIAENIRRWLTGGSSVLTIEAESIEEAGAFVSAAAKTISDSTVMQQILNKLIVVSRQESVDFLAGTTVDSVLIPLTPEASRRARAKSSATLRVVDVVTRKMKSLDAKREPLRLGRCRREAIEKSLLTLGISPTKSGRIAAEFKGSLTAALAMLGHTDEPFPWAAGSESAKLASIVLVGQWNSANEADSSALQRLTGLTQAEIDSMVMTWTGASGPLAKDGDLVDVVGWDFAWLTLSERFDRHLLGRFASLATEILSEPDPVLELAPDKRWMASIYGKVRRYSPQFLYGLCDAITMLGAFSGENPSLHGQQITDKIVRDLFTPPDGQLATRWLSLSPFLRALAEASPDEFLDAAERLCRDDTARSALFVEDKSGLFPRSYHTNLLWALENLAWSANHLTRVTVILGKLATKDPGGQLSNRPAHSLHEIFLPWKPGTAASVCERFQAIDTLQQSEPEVAWKLVLSLLPKSHDVATPTSRPEWRDWADHTQENVTYEDYFTNVEQATLRLIAWSKGNARRWAQLIKEIDDLSNSHEKMGLETLIAFECEDLESFSDDDKCLLQDAIRSLVALHRNHSDAEWSLPDDQLRRMEVDLLRLTPADSAMANAYLFSHNVEVAGVARSDWETKEKKLDQLRQDAVRSVFESEGFDGILRLAGKSSQPEWVAGAFAVTCGSEQHDQVAISRIASLSADGKSERVLRDLSQHYLRSRYWRGGGTPWLVKLVDGFSPPIQRERLGTFCTSLPASTALWDQLELWGEITKKAYWRNVPLHYVPEPAASLERGVTELLNAERPFFAVQVLASHSCNFKKEDKPKATTDVIIRALREAATKGSIDAETPKPDRSNLSHGVAELINYLEDCGVDQNTLGQLEWAWLPALEHSQRGIKSLQRAICSEPEFLIHLLSIAFRADDEAPRELSDDERAYGLRVHNLLRQLRLCPGAEFAPGEKHDDEAIRFGRGTVNAETITEYFTTARQLASEVKRLCVCDSHLAKFIAFSPAHADGTWPCPVVCDLIETIASSDFEHGIEIAVQNRRGVHFVAPDGSGERRIEAQFREYAKKVQLRWPRTGKVLSALADRYAAEATRIVREHEYQEYNR